MKLKGIVDTDFVNYKRTSMYLVTSQCSFKCDKEYGAPLCQNSSLASAPVYEIDNEELAKRYMDNPLTSAIVIAGLEPLDTWADTLDFIITMRKYTDDEIVIYTGYKEDEEPVMRALYSLRRKQCGKIIIKYGRYIPNNVIHFDSVLGINLVSDNQYGKAYNFRKISINNDTELVKEVRKALRQNDGYCPCKITHIPDNKCMCKAFLEQETPGECHCGLYVKE